MTQEEVDLIYDYLHENYEYRDGELISKKTSKPIGTMTVQGNAAHLSWQINLSGKPKMMMIKTMIYLYHFKKHVRFFDFLDGNSMNLNVENLIPVTSRRRIGIGVDLRSNGAFRAQICVNRKSFHLGCYKTLEAAKEAYQYGLNLIDSGVAINNLMSITQDKFRDFLFNNKRNLPLGVYKLNQKKREAYFSAFKGKHIGIFSTPEEAHEAYLKAKAELTPKIQISPHAGNIPIDKIQRAVDSVSNG